ncbi:MAG: iron-containing alcohol dehydrogenase, partial [Chloroflexi bacterium]
MMPPREFIMPAQMVIGSGAVEQVGAQCAKRGWRKALIVTDQIMQKLGIVGQVEQNLANHGIASVVYAGVNTEPVVEYVQEALA